MDPVVVQEGSTIKGYGAPLHATRTAQVAAPAGVTGRPQGARGSGSNAQPSTVSVAGRLSPRASTTYGGATRRRGVPASSRSSSVSATRRSPAARETSTS
jgi:hypothetical protein